MAGIAINNFKITFAPLEFREVPRDALSRVVARRLRASDNVCALGIAESDDILLQWRLFWRTIMAGHKEREFGWEHKRL
jgi:hypothetical protein